ncbi:MAG: serine/threonine protein kinase [Prevotellaceae bacterium]|jgi:serine/threonine-protein kinase|nr:serine/threonine protein kinase [Prevotellaceae bacterium]
MANQKNLIGKEILNYRIESFIGGGGMGSVYLAASKTLNHKVAVKVLNENFADNDLVRKKFKDEARTLLPLDHPNIVHFLNFEENADGLFLIMEYVDGITLDAFINQKQGLIPEKMAYPMLLQILDACAYAHKRGIVHRDIKPANIILTNDSEGNFLIKILDFGIARIISEGGGDNDSEKGLIVGTPAYMSPEQVRGEGLDRRSDIYSLGVLLHQMLTGRAPYDTTTLSEADIQQKVVGESLPRMKEFYPAVSDKMQHIVDRATQKDPAKRYQTCGDFRTALKNAIDPDKLPKAVKYAAAAISLLLLGGGWWYYDYSYTTKIDYYKDYVEQWGVPAGIGKADYKNRVESYKFYRQKGKVIRISHINCKGKIDRHHDSEHTERYEDIKLNYTEDGKIDNVEVYDRNGKLLYIKDYEKDITTVIFKQNHKGTEIFLAANTTKLFSNAFDNSHDQKSRITRWLLTYDENGFVKKLKYATFGNELAGDAEGLYGREYIVDKKGRVVEERYLGFNDSIKANGVGLAIKKFEYDSNDDWTKVAYFDTNGEPSSDGNGCPIVVLDNDSYGNRIKESYFNVQDSLTLRSDCNVAGFAYTIEKGNRTRQAAFGIDGQPCYNGNYGFSIVENEYDENGYQIMEAYRDLEGNAVMRDDGYAAVRVVNDFCGNALEKKYLDADGNACENTGSYAKEVYEYDSLGNLTSAFYFGLNDSLCFTGAGYAGVRYTYDGNNKMIEISYYGTDKHLCEVNGIYTVKYEYDKRGNELKRAFYAADGKTPVLSDKGIAGWEYKYDDNGNITEMWYLDTNGKHTSGSLNYAGYTYAYDKNGYLEEIKYLDKNGNLTYSSKDGYARVKYVNDQRGNHIEISKYDAGNRLIGATERLVFNNRDDIIERSYFDANGNKAMHEDYHKLVSRYNERHQEVEARAYNTSGELANVPAGYSIVKVKYNKQGLITEYATYSTSETLVISGESGYALRRIEYDAMNREKRKTYFDENSNPTNPAACIPEELKQYDKWGNLSYFAYADGKNNLINHPTKGYAYYKKVFDIKGNLLEVTVFDKNDNAAIDMENSCHKIAYEYNKQNNVTEKRYYGVDGLRKSGHAIEKRLYNAKGQQTEESTYDYAGKPVNGYFNGMIHKMVYIFDADGNSQFCKLYQANGKLFSKMFKKNKQTGKWDIVDSGAAPAPTSSANSSSSGGNWRAMLQKIAEKCPYTLNNEDTEMTSITLTSNGCTLTKRYLEISKYSVSDSNLAQKKNSEKAWLQNLKKTANMPSSATLTLICTDKAKRELFRINY